MTFPITIESDYTVAAGNPRSMSYIADPTAPADPVTGLAVHAGQLVQVTAAHAVSPTTGPAVPYVGVAGNGAFPGGQVTVLCGGGVEHLTACAAAIPAGQFVLPGVAGVVTGAPGSAVNDVGVAVGGAVDAAGNNYCRWYAYR
jgi:hypothetical protein